MLDTGPVVAYARSRDVNHVWARTQFSAARPPFLTCEAVITEGVYLLAHYGERPDIVWEFLRRGTLQISFDLAAEFESVAVLMRRYADLPMDLADACLVRMAELHRDCSVFTTDTHFRFYRRFGRHVIPLNCPV